MKIKPNKTYGQNFLTADSVAKKIVESAEIKKGELILEIGPGQGKLTELLLATGARVLAVEKDRNLIEELSAKFAKQLKNKQLEIIADDILEFDLKKLNSKYKVVANIPYYITGQILRLFLSIKNQPELLVLLVQKEVAERIARSKKESLLSISVKAYGNPVYIQTVKAGSFYPKPKVDSAIIKVQNVSRDFFVGINEKSFFEMLKKGFSQKRKQLKSNLDLTEAVFQEIGLNTKARAEDISLENWKKLYKHYANK